MPTPPPAAANATDTPKLDFGAFMDAVQHHHDSVSQFAQNQGYVYDPLSNTYIKDVNFLNPLEKAQQAKTLLEARKVGISIDPQAQSQLDNQIKLHSLVPGAELSNYIDPQTGQAAQYGQTFGDLQGRQFSSEADKTRLNGLSQANNFISQIEQASKAVNTGDLDHGLTGQINFLKGKAGLDQNARTLMDAKSQLISLAGGLNDIHRFSTDEINQLSQFIPEVTDSKASAQSKLGILHQELSQILSRVSPNANAGVAGAVPGDNSLQNTGVGQELGPATMSAPQSFNPAPAQNPATVGLPPTAPTGGNFGAGIQAASSDPMGLYNR